MQNDNHSTAQPEKDVARLTEEVREQLHTVVILRMPSEILRSRRCIPMGWISNL